MTATMSMSASFLFFLLGSSMALAKDTTSCAAGAPAATGSILLQKESLAMSQSLKSELSSTSLNCDAFEDSCTLCGSAMNPVTMPDDALLNHTYVESSTACTTWCEEQATATCCQYFSYNNSGHPYNSCELVNGTTLCWCGAFSGSASETTSCFTVAEAKYAAACATTTTTTTTFNFGVVPGPPTRR